MSKKVVVLSTGGTIASTPAADGRNISGALAGEALVEKIEMKSDIQVEVSSVFQKPSNAITAQDLMVLHDTCRQLMAQGDVSGIVITHGTDTMEDTAYFLESTLNTCDCPVVLTGSQRVPHAMGTDAYVNLRNAILVAASSKVHGLGVLLVFNETLYSANFVRKVSAFQLNGFDAPGYGFLGLIDNGEVTVYQTPQQMPLLPAAELPPVDILPAYLGARPALVDVAVAAGARGLVLEGVGRGHVPPDWMPAIRNACDQGILVAVCSSTLHGPVYQTYEFTGSLHDLECAGAIGVSGLSARKLRLRLGLLIAQQKTDRASVLAACQWQART
ncbi:asparaginase [Pusillimonas sp. MFBS29]|uniref:asparaginase n=1 Tax=Pusillimonas sp. MFBS29 TaxID=2886690 RepID=UPI001D0FF9E3|nr:asparaginase [Pusillimonas sp. MFBS29]MCC2596214.1 asparaginase [Pusillimonas sp. MFBS29]